MFPSFAFELLFCVLSTVGSSALAIYLYRSRTPVEAHPTHTRAGRNMEIGNQAGRDVKIKQKVSEPCTRELFYFAQCKDLQNTVSQLMQQLDVKSKIIFQMHDQLQAEKVRQERYYAHIEVLNQKVGILQEENDAIWEENNRLKYEQLANRLPVLDMTSKVA
jgi:hypothetical protein